MVAFPWVFTLLAIDPQGGLHEYDAARFDTREACIAFMNSADWKKTQDITHNFRILQRSCRKVNYGP